MRCHVSYMLHKSQQQRRHAGSVLLKNRKLTPHHGSPKGLPLDASKLKKVMLAPSNACHLIPSYLIPTHRIPSHRIASHPIPSHPIPSHPIPSHPIPSHPISSHLISSHLISSHLISSCNCLLSQCMILQQLATHQPLPMLHILLLPTMLYFK